MAIDTAVKRRLVAGVPCGPSVTPDSGQDATWRKSVAGTYPFTAAAVTVSPAPANTFPPDIVYRIHAPD